MKLTVLPKTRTGKWALGLSIAFIVLMGIKIPLFLPLPTPAIAVLGLAGFVVSLIALIKNKDRFILVFLPLLIGLIIIAWTAAELLFPH